MFNGLLYLVILLGFWSANEKPPANLQKSPGQNPRLMTIRKHTGKQLSVYD